MRRLLGLAAAAAAASALLPNPAAADHRETFLVSGGGAGGVSHLGASPDGSHAYFASADQLAPEDEDTGIDLYDRHHGTTELVTVPDPGFGGGRGGSVSFGSVSRDASRVFFTARESLTADDSDFSGGDDVYLRSGGQTTLVSRSEGFGFGFGFFLWCGATDDGGRAYFRTTKALASNDFEASFDLYVYDTASATLELASVSSTGQNRNGEVTCGGFTSDGSAAYFSTADRMTPDDTDSHRDVYMRSGGATTLMTPDTPGADAAFKFVSDDGEHLVFESTERLVPEDTDDQKDVYERSGGATVLVSQGPNGFNGDFRSDFQRASRDGTRIFFTTTDHLVAADTDDADDIFVRSGGTTEIVSHGPAGGDGGADIIVEQVNRAGSRLYFRTGENLTDDDTDFSADSYAWRSGLGLERVSIAAVNDNSVGFDAGLAGATEDGARTFFTSLQQLHPDDGDTRASSAPDGDDDVFERADGATQFVSTGPAAGTNASAYAFFRGLSEDGERVWWETTERLTADDEDDANDVYESRVNRSPEVVGGGVAAAYRDGDPAVAVDPGVSVSDPDTAALTGASVRVVSGFDAGDELSYTGAGGGITGGVNAARDELTLSGTGTPAEYEAALRAVTFGTDGADTAAGERTVAISVTDGVDTSAPASAVVDVALRAPEADGVPVVSGVARVGGRLAAAAPGWAGSRPLAVELSWERCDGAACDPIPGADAAEYAPVAADVGRRLRAVASASNGGGDARVASALTRVVAAAPVAPRILRAPAALSSQRDAVVELEGESGAAFECALDGAAFEACSSPAALAGLSDGGHAFETRQVVEGVRSPVATHSWTVDTAAPGAPEVLGPGDSLGGAGAAVAFSGEAGATFECALDGAAFEPCTSPVALPALGPGAHSFAVRQVDAAGNTGPPGIADWNVAVAPGPGGPLLGASARFASPLVHDDKGLPVECRVEDGSLRRCDVVAWMDGTGAASHTSRTRVRLGRGSTTVPKRGRSRALVHVRLTRDGFARIRRAGGAVRVRLSVRAVAFDGRRGKVGARASVALPDRYVLRGPFGVNVAGVHVLQRRHLRAIAQQLAGARAVRCVGHSDASARRRYARRLGLRRARAVCGFLAVRGVEAGLQAVSRGAARPRASNATRRGRALNRRVEVVVLR